MLARACARKLRGAIFAFVRAEPRWPPTNPKASCRLRRPGLRFSHGCGPLANGLEHPWLNGEPGTRRWWSSLLTRGLAERSRRALRTPASSSPQPARRRADRRHRLARVAVGIGIAERSGACSAEPVEQARLCDA